MSVLFTVLEQFLSQKPFLPSIPTNRLVAFAKNQLIFRKGDMAQELYLLYRGKVQLLKYHPDGNLYFTLRLVASSSLGLPTILDRSSYTAFAVAVTSVLTYPISYHTLHRFLELHPSHYSRLAKQLTDTVIHYDKILSTRT